MLVAEVLHDSRKGQQADPITWRAAEPEEVIRTSVELSHLVVATLLKAHPALQPGHLRSLRPAAACSCIRLGPGTPQDWNSSVPGSHTNRLQGKSVRLCLDLPIRFKDCLTRLASPRNKGLGQDMRSQILKLI